METIKRIDENRIDVDGVIYYHPLSVIHPTDQNGRLNYDGVAYIFYVPITERVKSIDDAYKITGKGRLIKDKSSKLWNQISSFRDLLVLSEALNEGWKPNLHDTHEKQFIVRLNATIDKINTFNLFISFRYSAEDFMPIYFKSKELAEHALKIAEQTFKDYFGI